MPNKINKKLLSESILLTAFLIIGLGFYIQSRSIKSGFMQVVAPGTYPAVIAILLMLCCIFSLISIILKHVRKIESQDSEEDIWGHFKSTRTKLTLVWLIMIGYMTFIKSIGYFETGFLFLVLSMFVLGEKTKVWLIKSIIISLIVITVCYVIFVIFLNIYLPSGIIFDM